MSREKTLGMTLVEVVMALAILSILLTVAIGSLSSINSSKRALDDYQDVYLVAQSLLRRMTRELQLVSCDLDSNSKCTQGKGIILAPDDQSSSSRPVLRSSVNKTNSKSSSDITFLAMDAGQYLQEQESNLGLVQINYSLKKSESSKEDAQLFELVREEVPYIEPAEEAYRKAIVFPVAKNVVQMSFEFYDMVSGEWLSEWGNDKTGNTKLPSIIRCIIVIRSANGIDVTFRTAVAIRTANSTQI